MLKTFLIATGTMAICLPVFIITMVCSGIRDGVTEVNKG